MFRHKDIPLFRNGNMRIYLGYMDGTVPEHFLDITDVYIGFKQAGGERMTKHMRSDVHINTSKLGIFFDHSADRLIGKHFPI